VDIETIESYDRPFFPEARSPFIKTWINQPDCTALGIMREGKLVGYGVIRACRSGHKIGPLFADSPELAESLSQNGESLQNSLERSEVGKNKWFM